MQKLTNCPVCQFSQLNSFIQTKAQMHPGEESFNFDKCAQCGFVFLNPRVTPENLMAYYTSYYLPYRGSKAWGRYENLVEGSQVKLDNKRVSVVRKFHPMTADSLLLDVGCGKPTFLKECLNSFKCKVLGIDFSDEGWQEKNGNFEGLNLQVGEVKDLPANIQPDVISMWHYLEHDYYPLENLKELRKRAKKDTTLIIEVPNVDSESRKKYGKHWAGWHTPRHTSLFSPKTIRRLLNNSGWETKTVLTYGTLDPYILYWMSKMEQKGIEWDKNMEEEFVSYVAGMIAFTPKKWFQRQRSLGILTAIATPK
ncbi:MAG: class I SAM-dependent methyltransferase [Bacteroidetes bacterium]|jgi:SAM-dependent methyltransferase|nr:class I SAM-dependent methyltransferase [Bacteroidota bacterium]MDF1866728.1 class I SAM-dependent methyltransferase [Saprospiraceae bacterium]